MPIPSPRALNWRPDLPDFRDHKFAASIRPSKLPSRVDLRKWCSPIENQGEIGSCTGHAIAGALEFLNVKRFPQNYADLSRLFIYYNERVYINKVREDSGAYIRDGIKSIAKTGVCAETLWPYVENKFRHKPPKKAYADALGRTFKSYERIKTFDDALACLAEGHPFVFGFTCYDNFMSDKVAKTGHLPLPKDGEKETGGHAVMAVGYNMKTKRVLVRNSWGTDWGKKGYYTMPFDYVGNFDLCDDFWVVRG